MKTELQEYHLESSTLVHAPGVVAWAINGYKFDRDKENMIKVISEGWRLPRDVAIALLSQASPYTIVGDTVVFSVEQTCT